MRTLRTILYVLLGFAFTVTYLFQRDISLRLVRRQVRQEVRLRSLVEERDRLQAEMQLLTSFGRVDSAWQGACRGRQPARQALPAGAIEAVSQPSETVAVSH